MSVKNSRILIAILVFICSKALSQEEVAYLYFKKDSIGQCEISMYRNGEKSSNIDYVFKKDTINDRVIFTLCKEKFVFNHKKNNISIIDRKDIEKINFFNINKLLDKVEAEWPETNKSNAFKKIYIIEKRDNERYLKYLVEWTDKYY
ncbi:hypothetical protein Q763_16640 [Flavobacterium beibuense F44-8]|uniref:Uncharacterized protein n=1 Tax=Flavobacterium beibuense F44-8 TaxID=1406840 RepID=A0A0A2LG11_9FLAO|nr:hypothetical protein [Flavobacterium beibuense]KGO78814.1 hypothetical protein Q763_16640 [Flavobacterium beibuense F44-8]